MPLPGNQFVSFVPVESMHALPILYIYIYIVRTISKHHAELFSFSLLGRGGDTAWANENYYIYMVATNPNHHAELFSFCLL